MSIRFVVVRLWVLIVLIFFILEFLSEFLFDIIVVFFCIFLYIRIFKVLGFMCFNKRNEIKWFIFKLLIRNKVVVINRIREDEIMK